jgi:hypothetical protein
MGRLFTYFSAFWQNAVLALLLLAVCSCGKEEFPGYASPGTEHLCTLEFAHSDFEVVDISTRATVGAVQENRVLNMYLFVFGNKGKFIRICTVFVSYGNMDHIIVVCRTIVNKFVWIYILFEFKNCSHGKHKVGGFFSHYGVFHINLISPHNKCVFALYIPRRDPFFLISADCNILFRNPARTADIFCKIVFSVL